jgi:hypothetical protein
VTLHNNRERERRKTKVQEVAIIAVSRRWEEQPFLTTAKKYVIYSLQPTLYLLYSKNLGLFKDASPMVTGNKVTTNRIWFSMAHEKLTMSRKTRNFYVFLKYFAEYINCLFYPWPDRSSLS